MKLSIHYDKLQPGRRSKTGHRDGQGQPDNTWHLPDFQWDAACTAIDHHLLWLRQSRHSMANGPSESAVLALFDTHEYMLTWSYGEYMLNTVSYGDISSAREKLLI